MFPELAGGYHLDRYARILKISDPPTDGVTCNRFQPYWAADIEILTPDGEAAEGYPKYESVPLPLPMAGDLEGMFLWPRPGAIVTVRWIEGRPDHPVIQHIYPMGLTLPAVPDNMARWQQRAGVHQYVDAAGNWERKTDREIRDTAQAITETTTGARTETVGGTSSENVTGSKSETIGATKTVTAGTAYLVTAPVIEMKSQTGISLLPTLLEAYDTIQTALDILATHTHPSAGSVPSEQADIQAEVDSLNESTSALSSLQG
jgi:hypothetical protein